MTAATARETTEGIATPSTLQCRPKIRMALPLMLMMFITREVSMEIRELPMARNSAAQEL